MLDTNVFRDNSYRSGISRVASVVYSSVVVQELLVIADENQQIALVKDFREKVATGQGYVPDESDWMEVGKCLCRLHKSGIANFGKLAKPEVDMLVRDALIARTAIRAKALLITSNTSDFSKLKTVFASLKFQSPAEFFGMRPR
jgi:predicted nucleic acid-binding protein